MHVIFGTGAMGLAVMRELMRKGQSVRMVNRQSDVHVPQEVEVLRGNAESVDFCKEACRGAEVVYNCTGLPYPLWDEHLPRIMNGIIAGAASADAKLIYGDNLYAYGPHVGNKYHEALSLRPVGRKAKVRKAVAEQLLQAHREERVRGVIGRAPDFYGPEVKLAILGEQVFRAVMHGKPVALIGNIDLPHTHIYIDDLASGLVMLSEEDVALGQVWHIPAAETVTTRQLVELIGEELGRRPRYRIANGAMLRILGWFVPTMREFGELMYMLNEPFQVDHSKFANAFPAQITSHRAAIQQTLEWMGARTMHNR